MGLLKFIRKSKSPSSTKPLFCGNDLGIAAAWKDDIHAQLRQCKQWVYVAVRAIASSMAAARVSFYNTETGATLKASDPICSLFRNVNPFDTPAELWMKTAQFLELTGNAYWYIPRDISGKVAEIWVLSSQNMKVIPGRENFIDGYEYSNSGKVEGFGCDEIIHLRYPGVESCYYGSSPLRAAAESVEAHSAMKEAERKSFANGAFPGLAIQTDEKLSPSVRQRLEQTFSKGFSGAGKAGKTLILEQGLKVRPFTFSPREMDYLESSKMTRDEILAVFGVPAAVAGLSDDVNRASADAMLKTFAINTMLPKIRLIEQQLTQSICPYFDMNIAARFTGVVPEDREQNRADMIARISNGITTAKEERMRLGEDF